MPFLAEVGPRKTEPFLSLFSYVEMECLILPMRNLGGKLLGLLLLAACVTLLWAVPAVAQEKTPAPAPQDLGLGFGVSSDEPINITSDELEAFEGQRLIIFRGHVVANQGTATLTSDELQAAYGEGGDTLTTLHAIGSVTLADGERQAVAEEAILDNVARTLTLLGNPVVRRGKDEVRADKIIRYLDDERSVAIMDSEEGRVQSTLSPKGQEKASGGGAEQESGNPSSKAPEERSQKGGSGLRGMSSSSAPIQVSSHKLVADDKTRQILYTGDVLATQEDVQVECASLTVYLGARGETDVEKLACSGEGHLARISDSNRSASGRLAVLYNVQGELIISEDARLERGQNVVEGDEIHIYLDEDRTVVTSREGNQVKSVFIPAQPSDGSTGNSGTKGKSAADPQWKSRSPVRITSRTATNFGNESRALFSGQVVAVQDDVKIRSDAMEVQYTQDQGEFNQIVADGNVVITQQDKVATGNRAVYQGLQRVIVLTGDPKVVQNKSSVAGDRITYSLDSGRYVVESNRKRGVKAIIPANKAGNSVE